MKSIVLRFLCLTAFAGIVHAAGQNPVPLVNQPLVPASIAPGHAGFVLKVTGTGFVRGAKIEWNHQPVSTTFVSRSELKAQIEATDVAKPATASVTVENPGGQLSNVVYFCIRKSSSTVGMGVDPHFNHYAGGWVARGDFNGDGKLDVAVSDNKLINQRIIPVVDIYLGKGDGTFDTPVETKPPFLHVGRMLTGDFNGDGKLDLALTIEVKTCGDGNATVILLGNGDGTLTLVSGYICGEPEAVADFNHDGKLDLILTENPGEDAYTSVYLGNGDGTFNPQGLGNFGYFDGSPVAIGDFNNDGKLDVAFASANGDATVQVFLGRGDGTFNKGVTYQTAFYGYSAYAADVNGDGKLDIVTGGVSVLLGNGDGTFRSNGGTIAGIGDADLITVGDFNGDGKVDVAVSDDVDSIWLLLGNGDGTFQSPIEFPLYQGPLHGLASGDFNNDGKLDLVGGYLFLQK